MITVNIVFFLLLIYYLLKDFNKTVICYLPLKLMTSGQLIFCSWKGGTGLQFDIFANAIILFFFLTKLLSDNKAKTCVRFPLKYPILILIISYILSNLYGSFHLLMTLIDFLQFSYIYIFWVSMTKNPKSIKQMFRVFYFVAIILCIDYSIELFVKVSPIREYMRLSGGTMAVYSENSVTRMGMPRIMSFAPHALSFGCYCAILFLTLCFYRMRYVKKYNNRFFYICLLMLLLGIILSNSRSPIIFAGIGSLMFVSFSRGNRKQLLYLSLVLLLVLILFHGYFEFIYMSLFHQDKVEVDGSTSELREIQLATVLSMIMGNETFGLGPGSVVAEIGEIKELAGAESVWFPVLGDRGYFGVVTYLLFMIWLLCLSYKNRNFKFVFFFTLGYFCLSIVTSLPSLNDSIFVPIILVYYYLGKYHDDLVVSHKVPSKP